LNSFIKTLAAFILHLKNQRATAFLRDGPGISKEFAEAIKKGCRGKLKKPQVEIAGMSTDKLLPDELST